MISAEDLKALVFQELITLRHLVDELTANFSSPYGPVKLGEVLRIISESLFKKFEKDIDELHYYDKYDKSEYSKRVYDLSRIYLLKLRKIHEEYIKHISHEPNNIPYPFELIETLKKYVKDILSNVEVVIEPSWTYNYAIEAFSVKNLTEDLDILITPLNLPEQFVILIYPCIEGRNLLLHAVFFHEIGHLIDFKYEITENLFNTLELDKTAVNEALEKYKSIPVGQYKLTDLVSESEIESNLISKCTKILKEWLSEIVADFIAIRLIGPAFLFSLIQISIMSDVIQRDTETHPSSAYRLNYLIDELDRLGYFKIETFRPYLKRVKTFIESEKRQMKKRIEKNVEYKVVIKTINKAMKIIQTQVDKALKNLSISTKNDEKILNYLVDECILQAIPPAEFKQLSQSNKKIALIQEIINSGWITFLKRKKELFQLTHAQSIEDQAISFLVLNELLMKAVEVSEILELWNKV